MRLSKIHPSGSDRSPISLQPPEVGRLRDMTQTDVVMPPAASVDSAAPAVVSDGDRSATDRAVAAGAVYTTASGGAMLFVGKLFSYGSRLIITVLLARVLGSAAYGSYNLALTVTELAVGVAALGLDTGILRFVAIFRSRQQPERIWGVLQVGIGIPTVLGLVLAAGIYVFAAPISMLIFDDPTLVVPLQVASLIIPVMVLLDQLDVALRGLDHMDYSVLAQQFVAPTVRFVLLLGLFLVGMTAPLAIGAYFFSTAVAAILLLALLNRAFHLRRPLGTMPGDTNRLIRYSMPVYFSNLVQIFGGSIQKIVLGVTGAIASVGIFGIASQLVLVGTVFHGSVTMASMPVIAALSDGGHVTALGRLYRTTTKWAVTVNLPIFLILVLLAEPIMGIFGTDFQVGAPALVLLACANLVNVATGPCGAMLDMTGNSVAKLVNSIIVVEVSVLASILLIPTLGLNGAAISALVAAVTLNALRVVEVFAYNGLLPYDRSILKPVLAAVLASATALALRAAGSDWSPVVLTVVTALVICIVFVAVVLALGLSEDDRDLLARVRGKIRRKMGRR
jgi:O-antigen/teichoic acid export membrane protein